MEETGAETADSKWAKEKERQGAEELNNANSPRLTGMHPRRARPQLLSESIKGTDTLMTRPIKSPGQQGRKYCYLIILQSVKHLLEHLSTGPVLKKIILTPVKTGRQTLFRTTGRGIETTATGQRGSPTPNTWARLCGGHSKALLASLSHALSPQQSRHLSAHFSTHYSVTHSSDATALQDQPGIRGLPHLLLCSPTSTLLSAKGAPKHAPYSPAPRLSSTHSSTRTCPFDLYGNPNSL